MLCPKCGKQNKEGASYCTECGGKLYRKAGYRAKGPRRVKRLAAAVSLLVIAAAVIIFFIFFNGPPVEGQWYSEDELCVLEFAGGQARITDLSGTSLPEYEYSRQKGEGALTTGGEARAFIVEEDELILQGPEGDIKFLRAKEELDTQRFVKEGLLGLWSNEKLAQVLELRKDGLLIVYTIEGEEASVYDYDIENGQGSVEIGGERSVFSAGIKELDIKGSGVFIRQKSGFDTAAFIEKYGNPLKGVWYDASGVMGKFAFNDNGSLFVMSYGQEYQGVYTFSNAEGKGALSVGGNTMDLSYGAGVLKIRGKAFTRDYVAQKDRSEVFEQLKGAWYDKQGNGSVRFSADGTAVFDRDGETLNAECTFEPLGNTGELTLYYKSGVRTVKLLLSNNMLAAGEWLYTREAPEQTDSGITGIWRDSDGRVGTLTLKDGGNAELNFAGGTYSGTYTFDEALGKGTITTVFSGQTWTFDMELEGELLVIRTGILLYNEVVFTREAIKPP